MRAWWKQASGFQRTSLILSAAVTAGLAAMLIVPWVMSKFPRDTTPHEPEPKGPGYSVYVAIASSPTSGRAAALATFLKNQSFPGLEVEFKFVNGPPAIGADIVIPRASDWDAAIGQNGKRGKVGGDLEMGVCFFSALKAYLATSKAQFFFFGTDGTVINHRGFRNIFKDLDPAALHFKGGCGCDGKFSRLDGNAGWVLSRSGAEAVRDKVEANKIFATMDWHWDLIITHWLLNSLKVTLEDASSAYIATELPDADVRLVGTDLEFLIAQCRGPEKVHCGACGPTTARLREIGSWPLADGATVDSPRGQLKLERLRGAPNNWLVETGSFGRTQLCWQPGAVKPRGAS